MKRSRLFLMGALAIALSYGSAVKAELLDITRPGDPIALVNGTNDGDGSAGAPPGAEGVENSINDTGQKYLNFLDLDSGLAVTPSANPSNLPVIGLRLYSANDAIERDPASYSLSGSNDAISGPWTLISSGALSLPDGRNPGGATVAIPPSGNLDPAVFSETVLFSNSNSYAHYQLDRKSVV